jgi:hypothetical protein
METNSDYASILAALTGEHASGPAVRSECTPVTSNAAPCEWDATDAHLVDMMLASETDGLSAPGEQVADDDAHAQDGRRSKRARVSAPVAIGHHPRRDETNTLPREPVGVHTLRTVEPDEQGEMGEFEDASDADMDTGARAGNPGDSRDAHEPLSISPGDATARTRPATAHSATPLVGSAVADALTSTSTGDAHRDNAVTRYLTAIDIPSAMTFQPGSTAHAVLSHILDRPVETRRVSECTGAVLASPFVVQPSDLHTPSVAEMDRLAAQVLGDRQPRPSARTRIISESRNAGQLASASSVPEIRNSVLVGTMDTIARLLQWGPHYRLANKEETEARMRECAAGRMDFTELDPARPTLSISYADYEEHFRIESGPRPNPFKPGEMIDTPGCIAGKEGCQGYRHLRMAAGDWGPNKTRDFLPVRMVSADVLIYHYRTGQWPETGGSGNTQCMYCSRSIPHFAETHLGWGDSAKLLQYVMLQHYKNPVDVPRGYKRDSVLLPPDGAPSSVVQGPIAKFDISKIRVYYDQNMGRLRVDESAMMVTPIRPGEPLNQFLSIASPTFPEPPTPHRGRSVPAPVPTSTTTPHATAAATSLPASGTRVTPSGDTVHPVPTAHASAAKPRFQ